MRSLADLLKPHRGKGRVVLDQFHPHLQLQHRKPARAGAFNALLHQPPRQPPPALRGRDRQLAKIKPPGLFGQEGRCCANQRWG